MRFINDGVLQWGELAILPTFYKNNENRINKRKLINKMFLLACILYIHLHIIPVYSHRICGSCSSNHLHSSHQHSTFRRYGDSIACVVCISRLASTCFGHFVAVHGLLPLLVVSRSIFYIIEFTINYSKHFDSNTVDAHCFTIKRTRGSF